MAGVPWITAVRDGWKWRGVVRTTNGTVLVTPCTYWRRNTAIIAGIKERRRHV